MFKYIWICVLCFLGAGLSAEVIGNVELSLPPPSQHEWTLLSDDREEEKAFPKTLVFAPKEGDGLELFILRQSRLDLGLDSSNPEQQFIDDLVQDYQEDVAGYGSTESIVIEWMSEEPEGPLHGYSRMLTQGDSIVFLCYLTTAAQTKHDRALWTNAIGEAKILP